MEEGAVGDVAGDGNGEGVVKNLVGIVVLAPIVEEVTLVGCCQKGHLGAVGDIEFGR